VGGNVEGAHLHIVHLADSRASLDLIKASNKTALVFLITAEVCSVIISARLNYPMLHS
jgi:hypothetical protein